VTFYGLLSLFLKGGPKLGIDFDRDASAGDPRNRGRAPLAPQLELLKKINIKPMPRLIFEIDRGLEHAANVEKALLNQ